MRRFGRFSVAALDTGTIGIDGGALFGPVPRPVWSRHLAPDADNRVRLAMRVLYILDDRASPPRHILVGAGAGERLSAKELEHYGCSAPLTGLGAALTARGILPDAITDIVFTHLHFDHVGGATRRTGEGALVPTFPNAVHHLQRRALKWAEHAPEKDRRSFRPDDWQVLASEGRLHLLDGPHELLDGLDLVLSEGHTVGMQLPLIDGGDDGKLLFVSDLVPTRAHVRLPWISALDLYPLTTLEEKRLLLAQALEEQWLLFFERDPEAAACRLDEDEDAVVAGAVEAL